MKKLKNSLKNKLDQILFSKTFNFFERLGFHVLPVHYYTPIPDTRVLRKSFLFDEKSDLAGIDMNDGKQIDLMNLVVDKFKNEYENFPLNPTNNKTDYYLNNGTFGFVSGQMNYSLIRYFNPKNVIEIGSGNSTLNTLKALNKNIEEYAQEINFTAIEPYPQKYLREIKNDFFHLITSRLENIDLGLFDSLGGGICYLLIQAMFLSMEVM
ncbi:MAG: hypothetical protein ACYDEE_03905 [Ignavibacteriaceae bacterium]